MLHKAKKVKKNYCIECKHYNGGQNCYHAKNIYYTDTPEKEERKFLFTTTVLNKDNDCGWWNDDSMPV